MDPIFASDAHLLILFSVLMPRFLDDFPEQKLYHKHIGPPGRLIAKNIRQQGNAEKAFILVLA